VKGLVIGILEFEICLKFGAWYLLFYTQNTKAEPFISDLVQEARFSKLNKIEGSSLAS